MTQSQETALQWLRDHNGDGVFNMNGTLLAGGELGPFMRSTWNALRDAGLVEFYRVTVRGATRVRVTQ